MGVWAASAMPAAALALSGFSFCINGLPAQFASLHFHRFEAGLKIVDGVSHDAEARCRS